MTPHNDIIPEAEKFLGDKTFLDTRSLFEAAEADAVKFPALNHFIVSYSARGAKRMITHTLLSSGKWERYNADCNNGTWAVLTRVKPVEHTLEAEIERVRGTAAGISTSTLWEEVGRPDLPVLNAIADHGIERFRRKMGMALTAAGYIRRSSKSVYWFAPGAVIE